MFIKEQVYTQCSVLTIHSTYTRTAHALNEIFTVPTSHCFNLLVPRRVTSLCHAAASIIFALKVVTARYKLDNDDTETLFTSVLQDVFSVNHA